MVITLPALLYTENLINDVTKLQPPTAYGALTRKIIHRRHSSPSIGYVQTTRYADVNGTTDNSHRMSIKP